MTTNKKVVIIGAGESGVGASILAMKLGMDVWLSENGAIAPIYKKELIDFSIPFEEGGHSLEKVLVAELVIKSPGVPDDVPIIREVKKLGINVISEIEFASIHYSGLAIAVTGSNGKTTTSGLLYHILAKAGLDVGIGGNYGKSFARMVAEGAPKVMVLEVSSFQLDDIETFKPSIAILLNITPDHLDRYKYELSNYVAAKFRIIENQTKEDVFIYNGDDTEILRFRNAHEFKSKTICIDKTKIDNILTSKESGDEFELSIRGAHNRFNAAACVEAARVIGVSEEQIALGLSTFVNLPHRLEYCGTVNGVEFINDSKATNVDAVYYALGAMTKPVIWVAGGTDKGNEYEALISLVQNKVKALVCLGIDNDKLYNFFTPHIPIIRQTTKISEAVELGLSLGNEGDVVLLSPACASFDLFKNYIDRGDQFREQVQKLIHQ